MRTPVLGIRSLPDNAFLALGNAGKSSSWRYFAGLVSMVAVPLILISIFAIIAAGIFVATADKPTEEQFIAALEAQSPAASTLFLTLPVAIAGFLAFVVIAQLIHGRPLRSLVTTAPSVRWRELFVGGATWAGLSLLLGFIDVLLGNGTITYVFDWRAWLPYVAVALPAIALIAACEELFFRGYLVQLLGRWLRSPWLVAVLTAALFALFHLGNPEFALASLPVALTPYFLIGLFLVLMTLKTERLELALGVHIANNLMALIVNTETTALPGPSVFLSTANPFTTVSFLTFLIAAAVFWRLIVVPRGVLVTRS